MKKYSIISLLASIMLLISIILILWSLYRIDSAKRDFALSISQIDLTALPEVSKASYEEKAKSEALQGENKKVSIDVMTEKADNEEKPYGKITFNYGRTEVPLIKGTTPGDLRRGAGIYEYGELPGMRGNCIIFGHRETAFRNLKKVLVDEVIGVETPSGAYKYRVYDIRVVKPEDKYILEEGEKATLTLVTCYPFSIIGSAPERYVIKAQIIQQK